MTGGPVVRAAGLTRVFEGRVAVAALDLTVERGRVLGVLGPNGAGKSTTVRMLTGLLRPTSGTVDLFGERVTPRTAPLLRARVGVQTEANLYHRLTVAENLRTWGDLHGLPRRTTERRLTEVLEILGLADRRDTPVGSLSKGLRQKAKIGRALLAEPELIFLDEPTAGLDPASALDVLDHLAKLRAEGGTTIVLCTHQLHGLESLCDDVVMLDRGRVVAAGQVDDLLARHWPTREYVIRVGDRALADSVVADLRASGHAVEEPESADPSLHDLYFRMLAGEQQ
ncbi:ABC transporter ATP-binding protein [Aeromicrobium senzhongii]|uniref:ABC transporter ATP-binding protein n=1 Tax=Aeromicrobium senzhongii TaxID=2663859 RepID=A0ABX6SWJ7_9ACTN|nr:ABC transporter ATP-binding protein [Aeromicrobium senzhongii]MTB87140.1 ATP-binding cassette domain-containing protein [Aeromicrobium senzhongii]QNL95778.1 ABC transporter ATP-binding protein [Aeromicrobium senzhongii]